MERNQMKTDEEREREIEEVKRLLMREGKHMDLDAALWAYRSLDRSVTARL